MISDRYICYQKSTQQTKKRTGNYAGNEIKDFGMEAGAAAKTVGTYTADDVRRNTAIGGMRAKEIIRDENVYGTVTYGGNISGTLGIFTLEGSIGLSLDYKGNIAMQATGAWGVTASSSPGLTISLFRTITNAPDIYELEKEGGCIGGSILIPRDKVPVYIGGDLVIVGDLNNKLSENYYGVTTALGTGIAADLIKPSAEAHGEMSYTKPITKRFNIIDFLIDALNERDCVE